MRPLRLAVACFPSTGGSGVVASELALGLSARGHEVHLFSSGVPGRLDKKPDGVVLHLVDPLVQPPLEYGVYTLSLAAALAEACTRARFDLIHVHYALPHAASALLARQILAREGHAAPRLVTTLHGTDAGAIGASPGLRALTRHTVLESDLVTVPSEWLRRRAIETLGLPAGMAIHVVPNFVDPGEFTPSAGRPDLPRLFPSELWGTAAAPAVLAHASNFRPLKHVGDAVIALAALRSQGVPAVLLLVGDGPERLAVARLARELGVDDHVAQLGAKTGGELARLLAQADLFLLPSETESFGLAALESLACGVPVIASDVGGLPEVIRHGETGLLVPPGDPQALATAARGLLLDGPRRHALGRAARQDALARFRPEPVVARFEELYRGACLPEQEIAK